MIIVAGGMYSLGTTEGLVLGPEKCKTWMRMNPLPRVLWFIASVNLNNKIYIIGKLNTLSKNLYSQVLGYFLSYKKMFHILRS